MMPRFPSPLHRVVLVDDDRAVLAALLRVTRNEGVEAFSTADPGQALHWLKVLDVGILLTDYRMAPMRGTELLARAREISPRTARILLTGFAWEEPVIAGRKAGTFTVFPKPWNDRELRREIRARLRDRELEGIAPRFGKIRSVRSGSPALRETPFSSAGKAEGRPREPAPLRRLGHGLL